jgi:ATP adenylyltransferase
MRMERLWAPWRMEFIRSVKDEGCFLCDALAADPSEDRQNLVLHRGAKAFVIMNRYPYNNGHLLISPHRHEGDYAAMSADELAEVDRLSQDCVRIIRAEMRAEGFNIGYNLGKAAGAGVLGHLHLHVVPRWAGDTNFMPAIGDVHVVPQALLELYDLLKPHFDVRGGPDR